MVLSKMAMVQTTGETWIWRNAAEVLQGSGARLIDGNAIEHLGNECAVGLFRCHARHVAAIGLAPSCLSDNSGNTAEARLKR